MSSSGQICQQFSLDEIKSATRNFNDGLIIGKGGFGSVYRGSINNGAKIVAIKRLSYESTQGETEFLREIQTLSKLQHENLVRLEGYCNESPEKILVYEYMQNGTLVDHLYKLKGSGSTSAGDDQPSPLTWENRLNICIGAAQGLDFVHRGASQGVIHRDIKGSNILLDGNFVAKIADFGLAKLVKKTSDPKITSVSTTLVKGTFGYMAPEYFYTQTLTTKTDIYAFGVVLLVVLSGRPAVDNKAEEDQRSLSEWATKCIEKNKVALIIDPYLIGRISSRSLKEFVRVSLKCVHRQSEQRPTMEEVVAGLELALRKQTPYGLTTRIPYERSNLRQMIMAKLQLAPKKKPQVCAEVLEVADDSQREEVGNRATMASHLNASQYGEMEWLHLYIQQLQIELTETRKKNGIFPDTAAGGQSNSREPPQLEQKSGGQVDSSGKMSGEDHNVAPNSNAGNSLIVSMRDQVARLQKQLQAERYLRAAVEVGLSMSRGHFSSSRGMYFKTRAELEEMALAEADVARLKQKVAEVHHHLNQRRQNHYGSVSRASDHHLQGPNHTPQQKYFQQDFDSSLAYCNQERKQRTEDIHGTDMRNVKDQILISGSSNRPARKQFIDAISPSDYKNTDISTNTSMDELGAVDSASVPSSSKPNEAMDYHRQTTIASSTLVELTSRLDFFKERRSQLMEQLHNLDFNYGTTAQKFPYKSSPTWN